MPRAHTRFRSGKLEKVNSYVFNPKYEKIRNCDWCGIQFTVHSYHRKARFCSKSCSRNFAWFEKGKNVVWLNKCEVCGKIQKREHNYIRKSKHCSFCHTQIMGLGNKGRRHEFYGPFIHSEGSKKKTSKTMKLRWEEGIVRRSIKGRQWTDEHRKKAYKSLAVRPNHQELYLTNLLDSMFKNEYKYVGDGQVWIGGKCPDWININGKKKLIEHFGRRWHSPEDEKKRIDHFKQFGFDCLVIWSEELRNLEQLKSKVGGFHVS
jgi:hypothetical protein